MFKNVSRQMIEKEPLRFLHCDITQRMQIWSTVLTDEATGDTVAHVLATTVPTQALEAWVGDPKFSHLLQLSNHTGTTVAHVLAVRAPRLTRLVLLTHPDILCKQDNNNVAVSDLLHWQ